MTGSILDYTPGIIRVNVVDQIIDHDDVKVWEVDLNSKYPEYYMSITPEDRDEGEVHELRLVEGPDTLKVDRELTGPTVFSFQAPFGQSWHMMTHAARYTAQIVMYRRETYATP